MYNSVLFPTDRSEGAKKAREHAIDLAADHEMMIERMAEEGEKLVGSVASEAQRRGITVETAVIEGDPAETIVEYAASNNIDIIVMPAHGRSELAKTIVGSVTDKVVRTGDTPVLVLTLDE